MAYRRGRERSKIGPAPSGRPAYHRPQKPSPKPKLLWPSGNVEDFPGFRPSKGRPAVYSGKSKKSTGRKNYNRPFIEKIPFEQVIWPNVGMCYRSAPSFLPSLPEPAKLRTRTMALTPIRINSTMKNVNMDLTLPFN